MTTPRRALIALTSFALTTAALGAAPSTAAVRSFNAEASTLGAIPDPSTGTCASPNYSAAPQTAPVAASGVTKRIVDVKIRLGLTHTYASDLQLILLPPQGNAGTDAGGGLILLSQGSGQCPADTTNLDGVYTLTDSGPAWRTALAAQPGTNSVLPSGSYNAAYSDNEVLVSGWSDYFHDLKQPNGDWQLRVRDLVPGDTGTLTSAGLTITEDVTGPQVKFLLGDGVASTELPIEFVFQGTGEALRGGGTDFAGFQCRLDGRPWRACPKVYELRNVPLGKRTFFVRGIDTSGNAGPAIFTRFRQVRIACELAKGDVRRAQRALKKARKAGKRPAIVKAKRKLAKAKRLRGRDC